MILLYALIILNTVVPQQAVIMALRMQIADLPLTMIDFTIPLVLVFGVFSRGACEPFDPGKRNYLWILLILWLFSTIIGAAIGVMRGAQVYMLLQEIWWSAGLPLGILCGYICVRTSKHARHMIKLMALLAGIVSLLVLMHFATGASLYAQTGRFTEIRTMEYQFGMAAIVAVFLVYSSAVNPGFFSRPTRLVLLPASMFAVMATLTRSTTITMLFSILMVVFVIPKGFRIHAWRALGGASIWLVLAAVVAVAVGSAVLGTDVADIITKRYYESGSPEDDFTTGRLSGGLSELQLCVESGFLGKGIGAVRGEFARQGLSGVFGHNAYTNSLATRGILGLVALVVPVWAVFHVGRRMIRSLDPNIRAVGTLAAATGFFVAIGGLFSPGISGSQRAGLLIGPIIGMAIKCYRFELSAYPVQQEDSDIHWDQPLSVPPG